jgi:hypothetical protein
MKGTDTFEKTRQSYAYLLQNFEELFVETAMEALSSEDVHQFLLIVTDVTVTTSKRGCYQKKISSRFFEPALLISRLYP